MLYGMLTHTFISRYISIFKELLLLLLQCPFAKVKALPTAGSVEPLKLSTAYPLSFKIYAHDQGHYAYENVYVLQLMHLCVCVWIRLFYNVLKVVAFDVHRFCCTDQARITSF